MARKLRLFYDKAAKYIVVEGINGEKIFKDEEDYLYYLEILRNFSKSLYVNTHAYSLLPKSIHLLCSFDSKESLSDFMRSMGLRYVSYFNKKYRRRGTLWSGRYKSVIVEDRYILPVMGYIESLPKENNLYSSYNRNVKGVEDEIVNIHEMYKLLGKNSNDRAVIYKKNYINNKTKDIDKFIENELLRGGVIGDIEFKEKIEKELGVKLQGKRGRPKNIKNKKGVKMYSKLVALDKEKHKNLKVLPLENLNFAKKLKFIPLLANEVSLVAEMFPVVFSGDENPTLLALTSLGGDNLAINDEGKYIVRYVPAYLRKYPFALLPKDEKGDEKIIVIDEDAEIFSKTKGKQLFTKDGEQSETLKNAIKFLTNFEQESLNTQEIIKTIKDADILEEREISIGEGDKKKVLINGFMVVNREKLNKLSDKVLASWVRKGIITFIDDHIKSLSKIEVLFKLASHKE